MKKQFIIGFFIWTISILFFMYECFLRVFPNTLSEEILNSFNINAEQFALISSAFFISYAIMQTPVGIIVQKFGVKKPLFLASFLCTISIFGFSDSDTLIEAIISRIIMGAGASFAYISMLSLSLNWLPKKHFGFFTGLSQLLGSIGPLLAGAPLALAVTKFNGNWRLIFSMVGIFGVLITLLILFFIKNKPKNTENIIYLDINKNIRKEAYRSLKNPQLILIIIYTALSYCSIPVIGSFWGTLYLQSRGIDKTSAAFLSSCIWFGYSIGSPLIGKISDTIKRRLPLMTFTAFCGIFSSICLIFIPSNNFMFLILCFVGIGFGATGQVISFVMTTEIIPQKLHTTILGLNNGILMISGALIASFIGTIIHSKDVTGIVSYTTAEFIKGLIIMPIVFTISFFVSLFTIKETYCKSQVEIHHLKTK